MKISSGNILFKRMKLLLAILLLTAFHGNLSNGLKLGEQQNQAVAPVLVIHGITKTCDYSVVDSISSQLNTYAQGFPIGGKYAPTASIFFPISLQGKILGNKVKEDPQLKNGNFSILAFSQGAVLAKYMIEYGPFDMPVRSLATFGGPNMGVSVFPRIPRTSWKGKALDWLAHHFIYWTFVQWTLAPADYFRDPINPEGFNKYSSFLAEANNERNFDQARKDKWLALKHALFVKWESDTMIDPNESTWWGQYTDNYQVLTRFDTEVYKKDLLGIKTLEEQGRADFIEIPGDHMHFTNDQLVGLVKGPFSK